MYISVLIYWFVYGSFIDDTYIFLSNSSIQIDFIYIAPIHHNCRLKAIGRKMFFLNNCVSVYIFCIYFLFLSFCLASVL